MLGFYLPLSVEVMDHRPTSKLLFPPKKRERERKSSSPGDASLAFYLKAKYEKIAF